MDSERAGRRALALGLAAVAIGIAMSGSIPLAVCVGGAETAVCRLFRAGQTRAEDGDGT